MANCTRWMFYEWARKYKKLTVQFQVQSNYGIKGMDISTEIALGFFVNGIKFQHNDDESKEACDGCMKGKQTRKPFPKESTTRANEILEVIHTDVCGPMETKSLGGSRYFVTFIDEK